MQNIGSLVYSQLALKQLAFASTTRRCVLFEEIAKRTWDDIVYHHSTGIQVSEIGITKRIIADLRTNRNIGVWSNPGLNEKINGSDIDIFIETTPGLFVWYVMQAKALQLNGDYNDTQSKTGGRFQWEKLDGLAQRSGCIVKYLLYNGLCGYRYLGRDACNRQFDQYQYGCSIVKTNAIASIATARDPRFDDFHPRPAEPWRILVCCKQDVSNHRMFSLAQVRAAIKSYPDYSVKNSEFLAGIKDEPLEADENVIESFSSEHDWTPYYRVVIRTTQVLNEIGI